VALPEDISDAAISFRRCKTQTAPQLVSGLGNSLCSALFTCLGIDLGI